MKYHEAELGPLATGLTLADMTLLWYALDGTYTPIAQDAVTLDEPDAVNEPGTYVIGFPAALVTSTQRWKLWVTADPVLVAKGIVVPSDANEAKESSITTVLERIGAFTGTGVNTILGFFKALLKKDASIPSDIGGTFDPTTDSVEALSERLNNVGGLTGIHTVTVQFYRTATTTPIPDVAADVYNSTETARLNGTQFQSDVNGQISFGRNNGTYKVRAMLAGFTFTTGTVVVEDGNETLIMYGAAAAADAPIPVGAIRVYEYCFGADGITPMPTADVSGKMRIIELPYDYNGRLHSGKSVDGTYNVGTGKIYWDIAPGAHCAWFIKHLMTEDTEKHVPMTAVGNEIRLEDIPS